MNNIVRTVLLIISAAVLACNKSPESQWRTAPVEKGDLVVAITSTGVVNPHSLVAVGTQVSGTISRIFADFNSKVKKGELVAVLDTTFLHAAVTDAQAALQKASAQAKLTKSTSERTKAMFDKGLSAVADLDQAAADFETAQASMSSAQAQLDRARINLAYASIRSPINGVVVNRNVDVGQTVAASFNTPTLFTIADDLSKMQVQASIDEADIGMVKIGQTASFVVDAYPDRTFTGAVTQVRLQPTTVQNVVSYTVMIDVDNVDLKLLPGMTANVTIEIRKVSNVLKVPAAALRFMPPDAGKRMRSVPKSGESARGPRDTSATRGRGAGKGDRTKPRVFVLENGKPRRVPVTVGLTNGSFAEITEGLQEGQEVLIGTTSAAKTAAPQGSPLGMQRRMH